MSVATALSDPRGFREVYQGHHGFVWHALHRFGLSGAMLEDALQDVFVVAYRRREDFAGSPKAWLYAIARRVASNHRRSARRRDARATALAHSLGGPRAPVPEAIVALDRYLEGLSPQDRELFVLSEVEGMTGPEIAAAWGRNLNTVYTRIRKLRASLRDEGLAEQARQRRPRASAKAWAALLPSLQPVNKVAAALASGWTLGAAAAAAAGIVITTSIVVASQPQQPPPPAEPVRVATASATKTPRSISVPARARAAAPAVSHAPASVAEDDVPASRTSVSTADAAKRPSPLAREYVLLERARTSLQRGDAEAAMELINEHASLHPGSALADVRAIVRVEILCAQGKQPQARAEATLLLDARPTSTARRRLERSCAGTPRNPKTADMSGT